MGNTRRTSPLLLVGVLVIVALAYGVTIRELYPARFYIDLQVAAGGEYGVYFTVLATALSAFGVPALVAFLVSGGNAWKRARAVPAPAGWRALGRAQRAQAGALGVLLLAGSLSFFTAAWMAPSLFRGSFWLVRGAILLGAFGPWMGVFFLLEGALPPIFREGEVSELRVERVHDENLYCVVLRTGETIAVERGIYEQLRRGDRIAILWTPMLGRAIRVERVEPKSEAA